MRKNKLIIYSFFGVFTLVFLLLLIVCLNDLRNYFEIEEEYKKTTAVVTNVEDYFNTKRIEDKIYIEYDVNGKEYRGLIETSMTIANKWYRNYLVGDEIRISYNSDNPTVFQSNIVLIHIVKGIGFAFSACGITISTWFFGILLFRHEEKNRGKKRGNHMKKETLIWESVFGVFVVLLFIASLM